VKGGETLYSIAHAYHLNYRDIANWNGLGNGSRIREGQTLRLSPPPAGAKSSRKTTKPTAPAVPAPKWSWPTSGKVYLKFGESPKTESGIRITGQVGQKILASAGGEVVYAGDGLNSYGQLLIIKHSQTWLSAYGFNARLLVREGQQVTARQHIANMGQDSAGRAVLHFEIRRDGIPVDPLRSLPQR
jgi:lipoprotein NlpD